MFSMKKEKYEKRSPKKNIAFYVSLALCIAAVAGAAWNTYGSIEENAEPYEESSQESSRAKTLEAANEVSGEKYEGSAIVVSVPEESSGEESIKLLTPSMPESKEPSESFAKVYKPVEKGDVIKKYSPKDPIQSLTMKDWRTHNGVDISAGQGTPVHAVLSGRVSSMYYDPMLGNVIVIESNGGYILRYCGVTNTSIAKEGNEVSAGETIGYIGEIPSEIKDESHLHLEAEINGEYADPTILF